MFPITTLLDSWLICYDFIAFFPSLFSEVQLHYLFKVIRIFKHPSYCTFYWPLAAILSLKLNQPDCLFPRPLFPSQLDHSRGLQFASSEMRCLDQNSELDPIFWDSVAIRWRLCQCSLGPRSLAKHLRSLLSPAAFYSH